MAPIGSEGGARNAGLEMRLLLWDDQLGGWKVRWSSSGFRLPDSSVLSPAASVIRLYHWTALSPDERRGFAPLCPVLAVNWPAQRRGSTGHECIARKKCPPRRSTVPNWFG